MSDAMKRALRTLLQAVAGAVSAGVLDQIDVMPADWVPIAAVVLTTLIAQAQNMLEDSGTIPTVLK